MLKFVIDEKNSQIFSMVINTHPDSEKVSNLKQFISLSTKEFPFSVTSDSIAHVLENFEGKRVKVRYQQKNGTLPWRGDTEYLVYEVSVEE